MKNIRKSHAANNITVIITISHVLCVAECAVIRNEPVRRRNQQLAPIDPYSLSAARYWLDTTDWVARRRRDSHRQRAGDRLPGPGTRPGTRRLRRLYWRLRDNCTRACCMRVYVCSVFAIFSFLLLLATLRRIGANPSGTHYWGRTPLKRCYTKLTPATRSSVNK